MKLIELAEYLHDLGLNVMPIVCENNKKRPYLPSQKNPYEWKHLKEKRLSKKQLVDELNQTMKNQVPCFLGVIPGLIKEGKYKDKYFFAIDLDSNDLNFLVHLYI